ncbi:hypothetical protein HY500_03030 [Candidatus Woesearchaeota archaeon]|nr:hypothetical protein [Candidatus Woesearchaeota archaeon]
MNELNDGRRDEPRVEDTVRNDFPRDATVEERKGVIHATDGSFKILYPNKRENPDGSVTVDGTVKWGDSSGCTARASFHGTIPRDARKEWIGDRNEGYWAPRREKQYP